MGCLVWNLTLKMLGKSSKPHLSAKAAETKGCLLFAVQALERHMHGISKLDANSYLQAQFLRAAGQSALEFDAVVRRCGRNVSRGDQRLSLTPDFRVGACVPPALTFGKFWLG